MRIAIVGTGIAGMTAAWLLHRDHDITVFEANDTVGGHTHTVDVADATAGDDGRLAIDTGFIVFNDRTYPNFIRLLDTLGVASQPTEMSFSVSCRQTGLEYNGNNLNTLFAQRRNLLRPAFYRMLRDILRFNRDAPRLLEERGRARAGGGRPAPEPLLGEFLCRQRYGELFVERYIVPMAAAIWSAEPRHIAAMPLRFFVRFFLNHGLLSVNDRPQWRVIQGGSRRYAERLTAPYRDRVRLGCPVGRVARSDGRVTLYSAAGAETFDQAVIATHSDQALALLADPSDAERDILGAIPYQRNVALLHTDTRLLPAGRRAWAAWNYRVPAVPRPQMTVTYNMNLLQRLNSRRTYCVTLNDEAGVNPDRVLKRLVYHHPVFNAAGVAAQRRHREINGVDRLWFCGAYWGYGFHEDGVNSALPIGERLSQNRLAA